MRNKSIRLESMRRRTQRGDKEAERGGDGRTKWVALCSGEPDKENLNGGNLHWRRTKTAAIWSNSRKRSNLPTFNKDDISKVWMKAMWPAQRSLHPSLRCGVMKAADYTCSRHLAWTMELVWTGQVVPAWHAGTDHSWTELAVQHEEKQESVQQAPSCFLNTEVLLLLNWLIFPFLSTISRSSLMDRLCLQEDVHKHTHSYARHNGFEGEQCVLLAFITRRGATFAAMTRHLVSLFTASQAPRAIPRITSM